MAWIDDRIWCHPKLVGLGHSSYRAYVNGIAYSSGMGTYGHLDASQIKLVGARKRERNELISARLWDDNGDGTVTIHDWSEHNEKRDERRAADRERKRLERAKKKAEAAAASAGQTADSPQDAPVDAPQDSPQDRARTVHTASSRVRAGARPMTGEGTSLTRAVTEASYAAAAPEPDRTAPDFTQEEHDFTADPDDIPTPILRSI